MPIRLPWPMSSGRLTVGSEPQRAGPAEVDPVQPAIDLKRFAQPSRAPRQISQARSTPRFRSMIATPMVGSIALIRTPAPMPSRLARDVEHERDAIGEIDIGVPALEEKRAVARGDAAIGVTRGIADPVGLGRSTWRPPAAPSARVRTSILPRRKRARSAVSTGISARSSTRRAAPLPRSLSSHSLDPLRPRRPRFERVGEVLGLAGDLAVRELHDAHRIGRPAVVGRGWIPSPRGRPRRRCVEP